MNYTLGTSTVYNGGLANSFYTKLPVSYVTEIKGSGPSTSIGDFVVLYDALTKSITVENTSSGYTFTDKSVKVSLVKNADFVGSVSQVSLDTDPAPNRVFSFESVDTADVSKINGYMVQISNVGLAFTGTPLTDGAWVCTGGRGFECILNGLTQTWNRNPIIANDPSKGILDINVTQFSTTATDISFLVSGSDVDLGDFDKRRYIAIFMGYATKPSTNIAYPPYNGGVTYVGSTTPCSLSNIQSNSKSIFFILRLEKVVNGAVPSPYRSMEFYFFNAGETNNSETGLDYADALLMPNAIWGRSLYGFVSSSIYPTDFATMFCIRYNKVINHDGGYVEFSISAGLNSVVSASLLSFSGCASATVFKTAGETFSVSIIIQQPDPSKWNITQSTNFFPVMLISYNAGRSSGTCGVGSGGDLTSATTSNWAYDDVSKIMTCTVEMNQYGAPGQLLTTTFKLISSKFFG